MIVLLQGWKTILSWMCLLLWRISKEHALQIQRAHCKIQQQKREDKRGFSILQVPCQLTWWKVPEKNFSHDFEIQILKTYRKPFTRLVEEGTYISSHRGELLNSKNEWHQAKILRTTTRVVQGGAEVLHRGGGGGVQSLGRRVGGGRAQGQWEFFLKSMTLGFSFWSGILFSLDWCLFYQ